MGQREGLSDKDVQKLNSMYKCKTTGSTSVATTKRPSRPTAAAANRPGANRPVLNFLGNLVSGFFQEENAIDGPSSSNSTKITAKSTL